MAAFVVGVVAGRQGWLEALATSHHARRAGWIGVVGGPLLLATVAVLGGPPPEGGTNPYGGGWNLKALVYAAWEQSVGLAIALGVLAWFHRWGNATGRTAKWLSDRAFAVYLFHAPVLVAHHASGSPGGDQSVHRRCGADGRRVGRVLPGGRLGEAPARAACHPLTSSYGGPSLVVLGVAVAALLVGFVMVYTPSRRAPCGLDALRSKQMEGSFHSTITTTVMRPSVGYPILFGSARSLLATFQVRVKMPDHAFPSRSSPAS